MQEKEEEILFVVSLFDGTPFLRAEFQCESQVDVYTLQKVPPCDCHHSVGLVQL